MRRTFKFLESRSARSTGRGRCDGFDRKRGPARCVRGATGTFTQVFTDQFDTLNTATWTRYNGIPTCCPQSGWAKTHVVATGGAMNILTYPDPARGNKWTSGGVSMARSVNQTYGQWTIRFRMDKGAGTGMDVALRPQGSGTVVDWAEESTDHGADRNLETATLHYGSTRVHAQRQRRLLAVAHHDPGVDTRQDRGDARRQGVGDLHLPRADRSDAPVMQSRSAPTALPV